MNTYYIYKINDSLQGLLKQYPNIKQKIIMLEPKNAYFTKQLETFFDTNENINTYVYHQCQHRSDYQRINNVHYIYNQLTKETTTCKVNDYCIAVQATKKSNIFYDILYQYSKKYVIMGEQCIK